MSPMEELKFRNVQLQDKRDWMSIVESLDLSRLKTLGLYERSARQFNSSGDAVDLYNSMFKSTIEGGEGQDFREDPDLCRNRGGHRNRMFRVRGFGFRRLITDKRINRALQCLTFRNFDPHFYLAHLT